MRATIFMALAAEEIEQLIRDGIPGATVTVQDLRGDGNRPAAYVVSEYFRGRSRVDQHRMVYDALIRSMGEGVQDIAIQTAVPE
jgi:stress-induced morphogen